MNPPNATAQSTTPVPARDGWIDLLRGAGALGIVLFHFNVVPFGPAPGGVADAWSRFWRHGYFGVAVFFLLSGYCLVPGWGRSAGIADFFRRRAWRLFPPYWASLLLIVLLALAVKITTGVNDVTPFPRSAAAVIATLCLATAPLTTVPTLNWVYWTLTALVAFVGVLGATLAIAPVYRLLVLGGLHLLLCGADLAWHPPSDTPLFLLKHWPVFGLGVGLAIVARARRWGLFLLAVSLIHAGGTLALGRDDTHYAAVGLLTAGLLATVRLVPFPAGLRPLAALGPFSYSLYLIHVPVGIHGFMRLFPARFSSSAGLIGGQLALLAATVASAWLFHLVAERPFQPARLGT